MIRAKDIMTTEVITISPEAEIAQAAKILLDKHINGLPVVEKGRLVGIICQSDLVTLQKRMPIPSVFNLLDSLIPLVSSRGVEKEVKKITAMTVSEAMTRNPVTVSPDADLEDVATTMIEKNLHTLPVLDGGKLVGIIGKEDVLRTLIAEKKGDS
jgi:CBS-domain-containing membrane protein